MRTLIKTIIFLTLSGCAHAATPVIFYSDLTAGPKTGGVNNKGVFVTIYGKNFGASQGGSTVSVGGGNVDNYPTWSDTKVSFQLGANAATGNIVITVSGVSSSGTKLSAYQTSTFTVQAGSIYFVDPNAGSNGTGTVASPFSHLYYCENVMAAGDVCYVRAGTIFDETNGQTGYHAILTPRTSGTSASHISFLAYPGETVTLKADAGVSLFTNGGASDSDTVVYIFRAHSDYITVANFYLVFTGSNVNLANQIQTGNGWWAIGNDMTASNYTYGMIEDDGTTHGLEILGNNIHDCTGSGNTAHSIYVGGPSNQFEIAWNTMKNNTNIGWEISNYHNGPRIGITHDNSITIKNAGDAKGIEADAGAFDGGDTLSTTYTDVNKVYNNIINNAGINNAGGALQVVCGTSYFYNNTVYGVGTETKGAAQFPFNSACGPGGGAPVVYFADNILYNNVSSLYLSDGNGSAPTWANFTTSGLLADNIYYGEGNGPTQDTTAINADPKFTTNFTDFHLQSTSPAKGAGFNTNAIVANDFDGVTRPQHPDIGAYQYVSAGGGGGGGATIGVGNLYSGSLTLTGVTLK